MGTAGISLTCCTMSPKSLIFLDLTERKLIVQTVICHFEDYPGSTATLKVLNVLLALAICGRFQGPRHYLGYGGEVHWPLQGAGTQSIITSCPSCLQMAAELFGCDSARLGILGRGERFGHDFWDTVRN